MRTTGKEMKSGAQLVREFSEHLWPTVQSAVLKAESLCLWLHGPRGCGKSRLAWDRGLGQLLAHHVFRALEELALLPIDEEDGRILVTLQFLKFGVQFGLCGDCLAGPDFDARLKPREAMETFFLEGAVEREARTLPELLALLARGAASAGPGRFKSGRQWRCEERAHGLCTFRVRRCKGTAVHTTTIHLLDLVGAAMSDPKAKRGVQQEDKTLKAVLRVVDALAEGPEYQFRDGKRAARHIPYRDAVATKLLRECFGHGRSMLVAFGAEGFDASLAALELARRHEKCRGEARSCVFDRAAQLREIDEEASQLCSRLGLAWDPDRRLQLSMDASEAEVRLAELRLRRGVVAAWQDWALLRQAPGAAAAAASAGSVKGGKVEGLRIGFGCVGARVAAGAPVLQNGVIVGGGVTGAAMLYQLAKRGVKCVLFEKGELTCGATWHAAGLVTRFHGGNNFRLWHDEGVNLFTKWQKEGTELSFHTPGSVRLIPDQKDYISEAKYQVSKAKIFSGLFECEEHHMISPDEIKEKHPLVSLDGIYGGIYTTGDGHIDPSSVTNAFAERARALGGVIEQKTEVVGLTLLPSKQWEVITRSGGEEKRTVADFVLNCAGLWCDKVGAMAGVRIPSVVLQHQYCITEPIPEVKEYHEKHGHQLPVLRDLKGSFYVRDERDGILVGPYESAETMQLAPEEWRKTGMPNEYANFLFEGDVDRLMPHLERAMEILPPLAEVGMKTVLNGPTMWPADGNHLVGPAPEWDVAPNFWLACAESYGIAHSAGLSRYLADWICTGEPPYELKEADPARYGAWATKDWVATKVREAYGMNNHVHYPNENLLGGRPVEPVPNKDIYDVLHAAGCQFGFHNGWESANYFDPQAVGQHGNAKGSFHRPPYQDLVENECRGMASFGGICYWPFAKYHVSGPRAKEFLDRLVPNRLPNVGRCALSYFLTPQGKIGSEVMLVRLAEEKFYVVSYPEQDHGLPNRGWFAPDGVGGAERFMQRP
ncbi:unnamed protein product [Effrenium voratum]|nr:unnamed protein product [Effrenium voratum]